VVTDKDAYAILEAAWSAGIRYYDVSPWYGLGLAERRYGNFLHDKKRSEYVISSKVGKLLKASRTAKNRELFPFSPSPNDVIFDYTAAGVRRSIEDSLQRLGIDSLDIALSMTFLRIISCCRRIGRNNSTSPRMVLSRTNTYAGRGIDQRLGIGVNTPEPILRVLGEADPDVCLMASQYSLIDHKNALNQLFPAARRKNASLVVGSSLNAGFISGSPRYNYGKESYKIPTEFLEKRKQLHEVAANHGVDLRTAALQFSASPDVAAALIVGASSEQQILADYTSMQTKIPADFWAELKAQQLIEQDAPTPASRAGRLQPSLFAGSGDWTRTCYEVCVEKRGASCSLSVARNRTRRTVMKKLATYVMSMLFVVLAICSSSVFAVGPSCPYCEARGCFFILQG